MLVSVGWFILDHAHPVDIPGHPHKGAHFFSAGQLDHPDLKRFNLTTPFLFVQPRPYKGAYDGAEPTPDVVSFDHMVESFVGRWNVGVNDVIGSAAVNQTGVCA